MDQLLTIYKASAGSGKTFTLAVEYIMGLLEPHAEREFEHTLAVTFTNKATAEMKSRILETLYGLKMGLDDAKGYLDAILKRYDKMHKAITEQQIREQAGKALTAILHDYSHFRVETIDSFFQSILRNMARELGLAANLQVELSTEEIIESAVDSLIETMDTKPEVSRWVLEYVREQLDSGDKWDIVGPLKAFADNIFREEYQRRSEEELKRISDAEVIRDFKAKMHAIRQRAEKDVQEAVDEVTGLIDDFDCINYGRNVRSFLTKARTMESEGPTKTTQAIKFKAKVPAAQEAGVQEAYSRLLSIYPERREAHLSASLALRHLTPLRLLRNIDECAREVEGDMGRFTLSSTPALLSKMIEGNDAPFIFEKIGIYINNVMIDEFQDTSLMQWENFKTLLFEKLSSGGKGLLVGDIKQSIYRWRGGDWKILYGIEGEEQLQRFRIHSEPLDTNYRSHQVVVDFNNAFFPPAARLLDDIKPDAEIKLGKIYEDVGQKPKKKDGKGYVRIKLYKDKEEDNTICDMAEQIRRLQAGGLELNQIAILVRWNKDAQKLIDGFSQYAPDIRLISDEAFLLEASVSVQMIIAALRMLIDKNHTDGISEKYLMLHYLRDVLGQADATLQSIALQKAEQVLPEEFAAHKEELLQLPLYLLVERLWRIFSLGSIQGEGIYVLTFFDELQNHLRNAISPDIQTFLTAWDEKLHLRSVPASAVAGVRILTIHKSKGLEFHTVMLPFCDWKIEGDRQGDVLWCETEKAPFGELGALPISIHAKDVRSSVFAPDYEEEHLERRVDALNTLYVAFTRAECNLYVWGKTKPYEKFVEKDKTIKSVTSAAELIYRSLRNDENDKDDTCFTYEVGSPLPAPPLGECHNAAVPSAEAHTQGVGGEEANRLRIEHRTTDAVDVKVVTRDPRLYFMQSNQAQDYLENIKESEERRVLRALTARLGPKESKKSEESKLQPGAEAYSDSSLFTLHSSLPTLSQREVGKRMHEVLSRISDVSQLDEALCEARKEGIIGEDKEWEDIIERIREGFRNPLVASWFKAGNIIYNECGIASIDKDGLPCVLRPDRVVMTEDSITVIDYKFGHPSRHYYDQVKAYMSLMSRMYPEHEVKGYLWYIMGKGAISVQSS